MTAMDGAALYLMENGYPNFLSLTYGVPKLSEIEEIESLSQDIQDQKDVIFENVYNMGMRVAKKYEKQKRRIKRAGEYIDQSTTIPISDKEKLRQILHINPKSKTHL